MTGLEGLLLGFGLGFRHAMDADHVVVVSTLLTREPGTWRAVRIAALWGAGHTSTFLGLGLLVVLAGLPVPSGFERFAEVLVAALLVGFGAAHLSRALRRSVQVTPETPVVFARPVAIGLVHGLAGSAGVALLAATALPSRSVAVFYLCLVALGTVLGMVALTAALSRPVAWSMQRDGALKKLVACTAGGMSLTLGTWILFQG